MLALIASLVLSISGSTVLNMWYDQDIDRVMNRTHHRPLAQERIPKNRALIFGIILILAGVGFGITLSWLFGVILFSGVFFDVVVYTFWLKRRTCWSVLWGGLAGGMPVLAGRVLGMGRFEEAGVLLMLSVVFWIPTHMLTFSLRYDEDYRAAGIPTFPSTYGDGITRKVIAFSSVLAGALVFAVALLVGVSQGYLHLLGLLAGGLIFFSFLVLVKPSKNILFGMFKYASIYMLVAMLMFAW
jgi:protoheme IX farnesyltransferase